MSTTASSDTVRQAASPASGLARLVRNLCRSWRIPRTGRHCSSFFYLITEGEAHATSNDPPTCGIHVIRRVRTRQHGLEAHDDHAHRPDASRVHQSGARSRHSTPRSSARRRTAGCQRRSRRTRAMNVSAKEVNVYPVGSRHGHHGVSMTGVSSLLSASGSIQLTTK